MKVYELKEWLEQTDSEADVFIEGADSMLHEFKVEETPETFDGFDEVTPAGLKLVMTD